jgi:hypothetical protein
MAINTQKVVVGGLAAGVVLNVVGFVGFGMLLGARFTAEMDAVVPGLSAKMNTGANMGVGIASQFVIGLLLAWLYAAMRPRFGAGMKTAVYAALVIWLCGDVFYLDNWQSGMMSMTSYVYAGCMMLVGLIAAGAVAGMLYKEEG